MQELSRQIIKNLSADDITYHRGIYLYRNSQVKNISVIKTTGQMRITVTDVFDYKVTINDQPDGTIEYTCNCASSAKNMEKGACKHVVAGLFALLKVQEKDKLMQLPNPEDRRACSVLDFFQAQEDMIFPKSVFHIEPIITVPEILGKQGTCAYLSIKAGHDKLYKVQTIKKFLTDYIKHTDL